MILNKYLNVLMFAALARHYFQDFTLIMLDNYSKSWFKVCQPAGGVTRCSTYLFPMRSPGSHPPFRGFPLSSHPPISFSPLVQRKISLAVLGIIILSTCYRMQILDREREAHWTGTDS